MDHGQMIGTLISPYDKKFPFPIFPIFLDSQSPRTYKKLDNLCQYHVVQEKTTRT